VSARRRRAVSPALRLAIVLWIVATALAAPWTIVPGLGASPASAATPIAHKGVTYGTDGGQTLVLDAIQPSGGGLHPAVILVHGGQWVSETRSIFIPAAFKFAEAGWVAFTIDYNMNAPRYPREIDDVSTAVTWVRQHASTYGVDPKRIGLLGASSGADIAGVEAARGSGALDTGDRVKAVVTWSGPMELPQLVSDPQDGCSGPTCQKRSILVPAVQNYLGCSLAECPDDYSGSSVTPHLDKTDPPMFLVNSEDEVIPLSQAQDVATKLESLGIPHELDVIPGTGHANVYGAQAVEPSIEFLTKYVGAPSGSSGGSGGGGQTGGQGGPGGGSASRTGWVLWAVVAAAIVFGLAVGVSLYRMGGRTGSRRAPPSS
jgi:acetyl esterase/lipase